MALAKMVDILWLFDRCLLDSDCVRFLLLLLLAVALMQCGGSVFDVVWS